MTGKKIGGTAPAGSKVTLTSWSLLERSFRRTSMDSTPRL